MFFCAGHSHAALFLAFLQTLPQDPEPSLDLLHELYRDPLRFEQLSGAVQDYLICRYGPRVRPSERVDLEPITLSDPLLQLRSLQPASGSVGENALGSVLVNDPLQDVTTYDTQCEAVLVLGRPGRLVAAFLNTSLYPEVTGWSTSTDGGASWTDHGRLPDSSYAGARGDAVLARHDASGRIYLSTSSSGDSKVYRTDDDGQSWLAPVAGIPPGKASIAVDNFTGLGNGTVYLIRNSFSIDIDLYRSTDMGETFGPSGGIRVARPGDGGQVVVTPDHGVHVFWLHSQVPGTEIRTSRSTDGGLTFGPPITAATLTSRGGEDLFLVSGVRANSFPQCAVNPVSGHLYVVYADPAEPFFGDRGNIFMVVSGDQGASWSAPQQVNSDATARAQYFPSIAVKSDGNGLAVCWHDNRADPDDRKIERWGATATISGAFVAFGPDFRLSPQFEPVGGVDESPHTQDSRFMGGSDQLVADDTTYYAAWTDNRDDSNGDLGRKSLNVRFAKFTQDGPGTMLEFGGAAIGGGNLNGQVDFDECNELFVTLSNIGPLPVTGIFAELSTTTPRVTVVDAVRAFPDLLAGDARSNTIPFRVSSSPTFVSGTPIELELRVSTSAGTWPYRFRLLTGRREYVVTTSSQPLLGGDVYLSWATDESQLTDVQFPFPVAFYDDVFDRALLSQHGNIQFVTRSEGTVNFCLPVHFSDVILPYWDYLQRDIPLNLLTWIRTRVIGATPTRSFVIEWHMYRGAGTASFEVRLHEGSSSFEIVRGTDTIGSSSATIGCQQGRGWASTQVACNELLGSSDRMYSFTLPDHPSGGGGCINAACLTLDFEDSLGHAPIANGQVVSDEYAPWVSIHASGSNLGPVAFDSTPGGVNDLSINSDLLVDRGNLLLLQSNQFPDQSVPGIFDTVTDAAEGGKLVFDFSLPIDPRSVLLVDLNPKPNRGASVTLVDENGRTRVYNVQPGYTGTYRDAGPWPLDLSTTAVQFGKAPGHGQATAVEAPGFVQGRVVRLVVHITGFGAIDDLQVCR